MTVFNFTVFGSVNVPEGVKEDDINIVVTTPKYESGGQEVEVPEGDWDIHEIDIEPS